MTLLETLHIHRQNRVTPFGDIERSAAKGLFLGNRGDLLRKDGSIGRRFKQTFWITCTREEIFGRKVPFDRPGRYTPLFFLDEVTALAAGHRPCAMCRRDAYNRFRACWVKSGFSTDNKLPSAPQMDACLHAARIKLSGEKITFQSKIGEIPDGVMFTISGSTEQRLLWHGFSWRWSHFGYDEPVRLDSSLIVDVLTPKPVVQVLAQGFCPVVHGSIEAGSSK